jgi:hypothetical protein
VWSPPTHSDAALLDAALPDDTLPNDTLPGDDVSLPAGTLLDDDLAGLEGLLDGEFLLLECDFGVWEDVM